MLPKAIERAINESNDKNCLQQTALELKSLTLADSIEQNVHFLKEKIIDCLTNNESSNEAAEILELEEALTNFSYDFDLELIDKPIQEAIFLIEKKIRSLEVENLSVIDDRVTKVGSVIIRKGRRRKKSNTAKPLLAGVNEANLSLEMASLNDENQLFLQELQDFIFTIPSQITSQNYLKAVARQTLESFANQLLSGDFENQLIVYYLECLGEIRKRHVFRLPKKLKRKITEMFFEISLNFEQLSTNSLLDLLIASSNLDHKSPQLDNLARHIKKRNLNNIPKNLLVTTIKALSDLEKFNNLAIYIADLIKEDRLSKSDIALISRALAVLKAPFDLGVQYLNLATRKAKYMNYVDTHQCFVSSIHFNYLVNFWQEKLESLLAEQEKRTSPYISENEDLLFKATKKIYQDHPNVVEISCHKNHFGFELDICLTLEDGNLINIEYDGNRYHGLSTKKKNELRDECLKKLGVKVIRFSAEEINEILKPRNS